MATARAACVGCSTLGLGHSLLAYGAVLASANASAGRSLQTLCAALLRDWRRVLQLALALSVPALLLNLTIWLFNLAYIWRGDDFQAVVSSISVAIIFIPVLPLIALMAAFRWSLAPTVMFYESLGPIAALRRSAQIVEEQRLSMFFLLLFCGLIGWLILSVPAGVILLLVRVVMPSTPEMMLRFLELTWAIGSVLIAPLLALGPVEFYLLLHVQTVKLIQQVEDWETEQKKRDNVMML